MEIVRGPETYRLDAKPIGKGTFGQVYVASCLSATPPKQVAIKRFESCSKEGIDATTIREVSNLQILCHKNIVSFLDAFVDQNTVWLVMQLCDCDLLHFSMKFPLRRIPKAETCRLFGELIEGVAYMHDRRMLHRDLKPGNLLIGPNDVLKIADLGLSRWVLERQKLTPDVCTSWYRAPEIFFGRDYSYSADMWSVGCILAEMEAGKALFRADGEIAIVKKIVERLGCINDESDLAALLDSSPHPFATLLSVSRGALTRSMKNKKSPSLFCEFASSDILMQVLKYNPAARISAHSARQLCELCV